MRPPIHNKKKYKNRCDICYSCFHFTPNTLFFIEMTKLLISTSGIFCLSLTMAISSAFGKNCLLLAKSLWFKIRQGFSTVLQSGLRQGLTKHDKSSTVSFLNHSWIHLSAWQEALSWSKIHPAQPDKGRNGMRWLCSIAYCFSGFIRPKLSISYAIRHKKTHIKLLWTSA